MNKKYFVTGIGTEIGKTVVSAVLVRALQADYWKPVQSGDLHHTDTDKVSDWAGMSADRIHPEAYRLHLPMSPHASAEADGVAIRLDAFQLPETENDLIVEGAGGLMVPLNQEDCMIDLIARLNIPVVLVSRNYLGSINHTLLSIEALRSRNIPIAGLVFNGESVPTTESIITTMTGLECWFRIPELSEVSPEKIAELAAGISF
ncbi:dethiobiotin synthase [Flavilitoribacter nigricans]|uniref:ATP-dependent dethiobiotin synthetase BioD n=1 Tax=Flavilitoribacter nigricans (strain ATCC 23147 / DSM 23189 / NBRC 102662 / NCIMB 1420 / SS-2) TaxID=1122177 RepID=A0A2D0N002_FLAN2|nr:dethiobiotin synthase [Flavilitoribacter nigricans]PHN01797.1 dethiobiotin synthase [Flavilitoribacter nigricans DSM 23189 = NBRC 102662]